MKKCPYSSWLTKNKIWASIPLRLVLAAVFMVHGWQKLTGLEGTAGFFGSIGIPLAGTMALVVGIIEFGGGLAVLLGLGTRYVASLLAIVMIVASLKVHLPNGFFLSAGGYEFTLTLLGAAIALAFLGAGPLSLDSKWCKDAK